jgi:hypothetical protein
MSRSATTTRRIVLGAAALALPLPAFAHHSASMFDREKPLTLSGEVKSFQWTNPHTWIQVVVRRNGKLEEWSIEGQSPNTLSRKGWRKNTFVPGQKVTIKTAPMRDGSHAGLFMSATFADGRVLTA